MNDIEELEELIKNDEGRDLDFKERLNLDNNEEKGKFLRNIIAIANSADFTGYLIIGITDDKKVQGTDKLQEEKIQQLCSEYIEQPIEIKCSNITYQEVNIGVITIETQNKPYEFSKNIAKYQKNDSYIRKGSVTKKASTKDIIGIYIKSLYLENLRGSRPSKNIALLDHDIKETLTKKEKLNSDLKLHKHKMHELINTISNLEISSFLISEDGAILGDKEKNDQEIKIKMQEKDRLEIKIASIEKEISEANLQQDALMKFKYKK